MSLNPFTLDLSQITNGEGAQEAAKDLLAPYLIAGQDGVVVIDAPGITGMGRFKAFDGVCEASQGQR